METQRQHARILVTADDCAFAAQVVEVLNSDHLASALAPTPQILDQVLTGDRLAVLIIAATQAVDVSLDLCRRLRRSSAISILLLLPADRQIEGLDAGADHCLSLEGGLRQLPAHVRALLRRSEMDEEERRGPLRFEGWLIDPHRRKLSAPDGSNVGLLAAEFDLLIALCRKPGTVLSRRSLLDATHIGLGRPLERSVDVHICRLRRKLALGGDGGELIQTVRLGGYIFVAQVNPE